MLPCSDCGSPNAKPHPGHLSLYLHFPFCVRKCLYCDFNSEGGREVPGEEYAKLLVKEMELRRSTLKEQPASLTLYFGGGTPSLMEPRLVLHLVEGARRLFGLAPDAEVTLEANPGTVTLESLKGYRAAGVNRLSLGVQSLDDRCLSILGRAHGARQALEAYAAAREAGFRNISIDLMHSLPGQSAAAWRETLAGAVALAPEHISAYALTVEEGTPLELSVQRGELTLPHEEEAAQMFEDTIDLLTAEGYRHYEISNFAKAGYASRHNSVYWSRGSYLGFGAGAHSLWNQDGPGRRWCNAASFGAYRGALLGGLLPEEGLELLSVRDALSESFFLGLRVLAGVDLGELFSRYEEEELAPFLQEARPLLDSGMLVGEGDRLRLSRRAVAVANGVFCRFL